MSLLKNMKTQQNHKIVGVTFGAFDFVHAGHVLHFEECKKHCDYLIVAVQTDPSVDRPHKNKPIMSLDERVIMLRANKYVDAVLVYENEKEVYTLDQWLGDVRFMGKDHWEKCLKKKHHPIQAKVVYTSRDHNYSSSNIRMRCKESA